MDPSIPVEHFENGTTIDDLPDSILRKILSLLPTKNVVGTSILSTRWSRLFPCFWIPPVSLELDDSVFLNPIGNESDYASPRFIQFVDKLFGETLSNVPQVESIILSCRKFYHDDEKLFSWIDAVLRLNVRNLLLEFRYLYGADPVIDRLNGCLTLVRLVLFSRTELILPDEFTLPNLKVLVLGDLTFDDYGATIPINEFIEGYPALFELTLMDCNFLLSGDIVIRSSTLNSLVISGSTVNCAHHLNLDAPNLRALILRYYAARSYRLTSFNALIDAHIDLGVGPNEQRFDVEGWNVNDYQDANGILYIKKGVGSIVAACASTTRLILGPGSINALQHSAVELPTFQNLTRLSLGCLEYDGWKLLARLLHNAPNLQKITFREELKMGYSNFLGSVCSLHLQLRIKKIKFCVFAGRKDEMKLLNFFLLNGEVLEKAIIHCLPSMPVNVLMNSLDKLPGHEKIVLKHDIERVA